MPDKDLSTPSDATEQDPFAPNRKTVRREVLGALFSEAEKGDVEAALAQAGFENRAQGARVVLLSFLRSTEIRDAVSRWFKENQAWAA